MKQNHVSLIAVLMLFLLTFVGCSQGKTAFTLPNESENFNHNFLTTFSESYFVADPQLIEASCSPWEIEIINPNNSEERLRLATLPDFPDKEFISVTHVCEEGVGYFGNTDGYLLKPQILQSSKVLPMKDWTIKKVTVKLMSYSQVIQDMHAVKADKQRENSPLVKGTNFYGSSLLVAEWNADDNAEWTEALQSAYASPCSNLASSPKLMYLENIKNHSQCVILVEFEKTNDIVWLGSVYEREQDGKKCLYICSTYYDAQGVLCQGYSELPVELAQVIQSFIEKNTN